MDNGKFTRTVIILTIMFVILIIGVFTVLYLNARKNFVTKERFDRLGNQFGDFQEQVEERDINVDTQFEEIKDQIKKIQEEM